MGRVWVLSHEVRGGPVLSEILYRQFGGSHECCDEQDTSNERDQKKYKELSQPDHRWLRNFQDVTFFSARFADRSRGKLNDGVRRDAC